MPIRIKPPAKELSLDDLETWNKIKLILSNQELCDEQSIDLDSADAATEEMDSLIRSIFSKNLSGGHAQRATNLATMELSKVTEKITETSLLDFLKLYKKMEKTRIGKKPLIGTKMSQVEIAKRFIKFKEAQEMEFKNNSEKISDYEIRYEPNDHRLSKSNWFEISDDGDLTPLNPNGRREFAWKFKGQPKDCLKAIQLNHSKSCPDIMITTILPQPHQPHQGTEIHSERALYWCTKVLKEDGSYERCKKTTSEGIGEDWRGIYLLPFDIETFASCIKDKIMKLCTTVFTYEKFVLYRTEA